MEATTNETASTETPLQKALELRKNLNSRHRALKDDRSTWLTEWRDIADHMRPRGYREFRADANKGDGKHQKIINSTPLEAQRTLASGMMAGITSPSRPWFRLTVQGEPGLAEEPDVRGWLSDVERVLREVLAKSNIYKGLHLVYSDLGPFGVSAMSVEEDAEDEVRAYVFPVGSYCLATSARGNVNTIFREVSLTVAQMKELFGLERCSPSVRAQYDAGQRDKRIDVVHCIAPNETYKKGSLGPRGKQWLSYWWESIGADETGFLREAGFEEFPLVAPRWECVGEDTYGHGPGFAAIGDCRALQLLERRAAQAVDKVVNPPMLAPTSAINAAVNLLPGAVTYVDALGAGQAMRPAVEVNPAAIQIFELKIREHENRIRKAFFADLWLMLSESSGTMTAREVSERREEKLLQLGTVLEALQDELLDPLINRVFSILLRRGRIPEPPQPLQGKELKVEYVSIMAQAQKLLSTTGLERIAAFTGNLAQLDPAVLDKLDRDQLVDEYADSLGVPPAVIRTDDDVAAMRAARAKQQQQQQALATVQQGADTAKTLADTSLESGNALTEMLRGMGQR